MWLAILCVVNAAEKTKQYRSWIECAHNESCTTGENMGWQERVALLT